MSRCWARGEIIIIPSKGLWTDRFVWADNHENRMMRRKYLIPLESLELLQLMLVLFGQTGLGFFIRYLYNILFELWGWCQLVGPRHMKEHRYFNPPVVAAWNLLALFWFGSKNDFLCPLMAIWNQYKYCCRLCGLPQSLYFLLLSKETRT